MSTQASKHKVVMARAVAHRWLEARLRPEHRVKVFYGAQDIRGLPSLLRSFRDGKIRLGTVQPIADLGIHEEFDHFIIWSSDHDGLLKLASWLETRGCETTGIW